MKTNNSKARTLTLLLQMALAVLAFAPAAGAQGKPARVVWDPPPPEEIQAVTGYNIYRVTITPALLPTDYSVNLVSPLPPPYATAHQKLNAELIPAPTREFIIADATPGMQTIVRAYSAEWNIESPDSDILSFRPLPGKVDGLKAKSIILESSVDLRKWVRRAVYDIAVVAPSEFFRLRW